MSSTTNASFSSSVNTHLETSGDPVAPPSPSKSPIGVGAPGSSKASATSAAVSSQGGTAGFGGLGGLGSGFGGTAGGIGGLGGLSSPLASATTSNSGGAGGSSGGAGGSGVSSTGLNSSAAVFSATNGETKSVSAAANAPIFKPSGQSDLFRRVNASMMGSSALKLSVRVDQVCCLLPCVCVLFLAHVPPPPPILYFNFIHRRLGLFSSLFSPHFIIQHLNSPWSLCQQERQHTFVVWDQ